MSRAPAPKTLSASSDQTSLFSSSPPPVFFLSPLFFGPIFLPQGKGKLPEEVHRDCDLVKAFSVSFYSPP